MFETIVWATDGLTTGDRALPFVLELARAHNSKIVAVHANELLQGRARGEPAYADEPELEQRIAHQVGELRKAGFAVDLKVETGFDGIPDLIADAAEEAGADLIVVATHDHLVGKVSEALLHRAPCPVLALPATVAAEAGDTAGSAGGK